MSTYFDTFGLSPLRLDLNPAELEQKFHLLSMGAHPDKNKNSADSAKRSAEINLAYKVLRDPWTRALYLLGQFGLAQNSKVPTSLVETYFELQEMRNTQGLIKLRADLMEAKSERGTKLLSLFKSFDALQVSSFDSPTPSLQQLLGQIQDLVVENTYSSSMLRDIEHRLGTQAA